MKNSLRILVASITTATTLLAATPAFANSALDKSTSERVTASANGPSASSTSIDNDNTATAVVNGTGSTAIANSTTNNYYIIDKYYNTHSGSSGRSDDKLIIYKGYTGWIYQAPDWYYVNPDTTFKTGWYREDGYIYYFNNDGKMVTGPCNIDGKAYYFSNISDGHRGQLVPHKISD